MPCAFQILIYRRFITDGIGNVGEWYKMPRMDEYEAAKGSGAMRHLCKDA